LYAKSRGLWLRLSLQKYQTDHFIGEVQRICARPTLAQRRDTRHADQFDNRVGIRSCSFACSVPTYVLPLYWNAAVEPAVPLTTPRGQKGESQCLECLRH
jgi:hypothetical protein